MFSLLLTLLSIGQFIYHTAALPAGPLGSSADGSILLPQADSANYSEFYAPLRVYNGDRISTQSSGVGARPGDHHLWPEVPAAQYYIKFHKYGADFPISEGKSLLFKAQSEVEGWIKSSKKGSYTPVDDEHHWREGRSFLTIKPEHSGYLLGDLDKYLTSITAFHTQYGEYWAWEAQLLKKGFMGVLIATGTARLQTR